MGGGVPRRRVSNGLGAFSFYGRSELKALKRNENVESYTEDLQDFLLPYTEKHSRSVTFQGDIASIHKASFTETGKLTTTLTLSSGLHHF